MNECLNYQAIVIPLLFLLPSPNEYGIIQTIWNNFNREFYQDYPVARWPKHPPGEWETMARSCFKQDWDNIQTWSNGYNTERYICFPTQTLRSQLPSSGPCKWEKWGVRSLGIWPGHKLHILKAPQWRMKLHSNHCFHRHKLTAKTNRYFSHMVGGRKSREEQMESLPEKHIKRQANQESQVQFFVLNLWRLTQLECRAEE